MLTRISVARYRSLLDIHVPVAPLTIVTGANGCGKSNLHRALELLAHAAEGTLARRLAAEGGFASALWAGPPPRKEPVRLRVAARIGVPELDGEMELEITLGLPRASLANGAYGNGTSAFCSDPEVKEEVLRLHPRKGRAVLLVKRDHASVTARNAEGSLALWEGALDPAESALAQLRDPVAFPELAFLRDRIRAWRFYHEFRADAGSPLRAPATGVRTPALASDGSDLAAALATIDEQGDGAALVEAVDAMMPRARLHLSDGGGMFEVQVEVPGLRRPIRARELSDGQLRYLCLVAALLATRPPALRAFNEPEASIHPDMLPAIARLVHRAAAKGQLWITTHSPRFAEQLASLGPTSVVRLEKADGATRVAGQRLEDFADAPD